MRFHGQIEDFLLDISEKKGHFLFSFFPFVLVNTERSEWWECFPLFYVYASLGIRYTTQLLTMNLGHHQKVENGFIMY